MLREVNDLLILEAYLSLSPAASVDFCFYEPAKSTKCIFDDFIENPYPYYLFCLVLINKLKIEWDREDSLFIFVYAVALFFIPLSKYYIKSYIPSTLIYCKFYK